MQSKILRLKILTVSLKLKFKCRLKIQCTEGGATQEATTSNGLYEVDQELELYPKKNEIELLLTLISEKGSSYNGGIVRTSIEQLRYSTGTAIKLSVSKCIDKQAWVEVKVISVPNLQDKENKKDLSFTDHREDGFFLKEAQFTPDRVKKGNLVLETNLGETRSEHGIPLPASSFKMGEDRKKIYQTARPNFGQFSNVRMHKNRDSRKISPFQSSPRRESPEQMTIRIEEQNRSRVEAERSASKLKRLQEKCKQQQQRVKQEQEKRKKVEYSEHNYKIELAKANIAKEEKQKEIAKKDARIKQLQSECAKAKEYAKKLNQLKEDLKTKEAQIKYLEDQLDSERKLAQQWKSMAEEQSKKVGEQADKYRRLHDAIANQKNEAVEQLTKKLKAKDEEITAYLNKITSLQQSNQRDKKFKQGLDMKTIQTKSQLEKVITLLKKDLKLSKDQYSAFCLKSEQQKSLLNHELTTLKDECDKLRMITSKATIQKRSLEQKIDDNEEKIGEMKRYREKYNEESSKYKVAKDQLSKLKRKHDALLEQNHKLQERLNLSLKNLEELRKQVHSKDIKNIELEQRLKNAEEASSESKNLLQKQRKSEQVLQKECSQMREKQKQLKSQLSRKEIQLAKSKLQLQNANEKIMQLKSVKQQHQQQQKSQPIVQQEQWENSKANSVLQVQRFLEMELINSKQTIADLESSNARIKEQLQKWVRTEYQWRENERIWQTQKLRVSAQLAKSAKEVKDLTKRLAEEDARAMILNEKIEKQKKVSKSWQEKYFATQASLKKTNDSKEETSSELQIKQSKVRMLENQLIFVRGELEQRETQLKRYKSVHDNLESENKKLRQEVSDLTFRIKEEQQLTITQSKKSRQQMTKYEARLTSIKRQFQKFKENLRNILVESIISQLSRDQQEKQITLRRRQAKLGLTLTNQLLIKLQDFLKELSRHKSQTQAKLRATEKELIISREEIILKTNQYQNTEGQLKFKLDELIDNLQKMKNIYSQREQQLRKTISDLQWQLSLKDNQVQKISISLKEVTETQQRDAIIANDNFSRNQKALCGEIEKMRAKLAESSEREAAYFGQITSLEEYIIGIESNLNNSDNRVALLEQQLDKKQKQLTETISQIETLKQNVSDLSKQKSQLKNVLLNYQSELQQSKMLINQYKTEIAALQKEKNEQSAMIRSLMKQKESFLHQYLASEEKIFHFETRQFQLEEKISALEEQKQKDVKLLEEARKKSTQEAKAYEANLSKKETQRQSQVRRLEEKLKEKEKVVNLLNERITSTEELLSQLKLKLDSSNKASQSRENELHESIIRLQQQIRQSLFQNEVLSKKNSELESQLRKNRESIEQMNLSIDQLNKTLTQYITANNKLEAELFLNKSELTQLREDYVKIKEELEEKDLQNYEISSNFFKNEMEMTEKIDHLQQKVAMQEESMIKYQEICEQYAAEIEALKKSNQTLTNINAQSQAEIARTLAKCKQANEEIQANYETIRQLEQQLRRPSYLRKEKIESSYGSATLSLQRGGELGI